MHQKLKAIELPADLSGMRVLNLNCGEGFFCKEALKRGASYVLGIDRSSELLEGARKTVPGANFLKLPWFEIPPEKFDVILFVSGVHHERDQKALFGHLKGLLSEDGMLILECGVVRHNWEERWHVVERHDGLLSFPSWGLLLHELLADFAVRDIGRSVDQEGDPIPRYVFHCRKLKPTVLFIGGDSGSGKTVLARQFVKHGCRVINLDFEYGRILNENKTYNKNAAIAYLREIYRPNNLDIMLRQAAKDGKADLITRIISRVIQPDVPLTVVEGFHLSIPSLREALRNALERRSFKVHELHI